MTAHILINGRPLCDHTACVAGLRDAEEVAHETPTQCSYLWDGDASEAGAAWQKAHPHKHIQIAYRACPNTLREPEDTPL